jgi:twitching motility protein PilI
MSEHKDPFSLLVTLEKRSKQNATGLPAQEEAVEHWNGIGFALTGHQFVAAMGDVVEILHLPRHTMIPGVKTWMQGIANVRGRLLPIMDLALFFNLTGPVRSSREKRALVIDRQEIFSGLIVDAVLGMQYFPVDSFQTSVSALPEQMRPFVKGFYERGEQRWYVFDVDALIADPGFINVAL